MFWCVVFVWFSVLCCLMLCCVALLSYVRLYIVMFCVMLFVLLLWCAILGYRLYIKCSVFVIFYEFDVICFVVMMCWVWLYDVLSCNLLSYVIYCDMFLFVVCFCVCCVALRCVVNRAILWVTSISKSGPIHLNSEWIYIHNAYTYLQMPMLNL